ncbi:conserved hypothetical protein [Rubrivivax sp. A210]|uniref:hypothetical protein n=1 Tax=Rubrivivax sp. A210 TaxID=2772301 RepID=UPI00191B0510|nr:hypothetical protein [Rubrivivax sp. A210]CAD5366634.1 conserved hypothetical protein [Rubrivivax sp. A210]
MSVATLPQRRTLLLGLTAVGLMPLAGCMTKPIHPVNADGTYCHRIGRSYRPTLTCTPQAVPAASVEAEAKRFEGTAGALTVYVLRRNWGDALVAVPITVDGTTGAATIPDSLVRLRLAPGNHRLAAKWDGRDADINVDGQAGEVRVVELKGSGWAWGNTFSWQVVRLEDVRERAQATKLVADVHTIL